VIYGLKFVPGVKPLSHLIWNSMEGQQQQAVPTQALPEHVPLRQITYQVREPSHCCGTLCIHGWLLVHIGLHMQHAGEHSMLPVWCCLCPTAFQQLTCLLLVLLAGIAALAGLRG
jgi:hypothetical protein